MNLKSIGYIFLILILFSCGQKSEEKKEKQAKKSSFSLIIGTGGSSENDGIFSAEITNDGTLTKPKLIQQAKNASFLTLSYGKNFLYSVSETDNGSVISYRVHEADSLEKISSVSAGGRGPCYVSVTGDQKTVLAANYGDGTVMSAAADKGMLTAASTYQQEGAVGEYNRNGPHAHAIKEHPNKRLVYSPDLGADKVFIYSIKDSKLIPHSTPFVPLPEGAGPRHIDFDPNGKYAFVINELNSTMQSFKVENDGNLTPIDTVSTVPADFEGETYCADVHVHPGGKYVFGSNRGHDSIVSFAINNDGTLSLVGYATEDIEWPRNFGITPDGKYLVAASQHGDRLTPFKIEPDGSMTKSGESVTVPVPMCVVFY